ncbi:NAD(+) diphosphatase [Propionispora vibrioides]|uniref:NAD(+) diphosphatase n=1 Tax=Propionispora vibrioides TaxID=112903 RepID=A0A1H8R4Z4_9FIRM|nr:NAD(+) diphosphatase [Propionispora vibrioides]SEO61218.1 NAD+ diphosphatase [Propionispora vibrioides]
MSQEINATYANCVPADPYCFAFCKDEILMKHTGSGLCVPLASDLADLSLQKAATPSLGQLDGRAYYAATVTKDQAPDGFSFFVLRRLYGQIHNEWFWQAFRAYHITNWLKSTQFCGRCGSPLSLDNHELAMKCANCGNMIYPRLSPAIIVAVTRGDKLLLARNRMRPELYSVIAGFVEPGETLEDCVQRELMEEVGVKVTDITYFGSQPWPFPDSLMIGFTAKAVSDSIRIDNNEIIEAAWFSADQLPAIPPSVSIGRRLIDWFANNNQKGKF